MDQSRLELLEVKMSCIKREKGGPPSLLYMVLYWFPRPEFICAIFPDFAFLFTSLVMCFEWWACVCAFVCRLFTGALRLGATFLFLYTFLDLWIAFGFAECTPGHFTYEELGCEWDCRVDGWVEGWGWGWL